MAKIHRGNLVLDSDDSIKFLDSLGQEHTVYWDDLLDRFLFDGDIGDGNYIGATNSVISNRAPNTGDNEYIIPSIWINEDTNESFLLIDITAGAATWELLNVGGSGGSIAIKDEGNLVVAEATSINFIGESVEAETDGGSGVNVYIPPYDYVSHWNTDDGTTNTIIDDMPVSSRMVASPTSEGNPYQVGGWNLNQPHNSTNTGIFIYESPELCSFDNQFTSVLVEVMDANGSVIALNELTNINDNRNVTVNNITVVIQYWGFELSRYVGKIDVSIDLDSIIPAGGRFSVRITHTSGSGVYIKEQSDMFYDTNLIIPVIANLGIVEHALNSNKWLSGLRYYDNGDIFNVVIGDIDNINYLSYPANFIDLDVSKYGVPNTSLDGGDLTDWTWHWDNLSSSYNGNHIIDIASYRFIGQNANITANWLDWITGSVISSTDQSILIDTVDVSSTVVHEDFNDENLRITPSWDSWDSTIPLVSTDLMVYGGSLQRQFNDWSSYKPTNTINYTTSTDPQVYYRGFSHDGVSHTNGEFEINGITEVNLSNNDVTIELSLDGIDWYVLNDDYLSGVLQNGDGCRTDTSTTSLPIIRFTLGLGGSTTALTGPDGWGIYFKVTIPNGSVVVVQNITLTNWL